MNKIIDFRIVLIGIAVHLIIFYSIFDVYFKSPLVHGMSPIQKLPESSSPAKRLVLFSADGLRYDSFYDIIEQDPTLFLRYLYWIK